jgi:citrate lyase subunit beta/citryl-CoA lyase
MWAVKLPLARGLSPYALVAGRKDCHKSAMNSLTDIKFMPDSLRRSVLSVPSINSRALEKLPTLSCDAVIFDLEDSVAPEKKKEARGHLRRLFMERGSPSFERIIRINPLSSPFGREDVDLVVELQPDAVLLPKVEHVSDIEAVADHISEAGMAREPSIWAMIETPKGVLNAPMIAQADERLSCFVVGLNDLRKETGVLPELGRSYLVPWLMQILLAGHAYGIDVIDSVFNDFRNAEAFEMECAQGRSMGFDGKMLIHPAQIEPANRHFGPAAEALQEAEAIVAAFAEPGAEHLNVITMNGKMVERLHLAEAEKLLAKAALIAKRERTSS